MEGEPQQEDFSKLSVEERLGHKNWKARVSAYEDLSKAFRTSISEDAPEFTPYLRNPDLLANALKDANAVAQEKAFECSAAFIEFGGRAAAAKSREPMMASIIDKNIFGATRATTKKLATELCLLLVECEDGADGVMEPITTAGIKSKQPKAVAGAVATLKEIVKQFGVKTVNVKPILKILPAIFAHADKGVRAEGTGLVQELHRYLGPALDPHLSELKPVQIKELNESFVGEEKGVQTRFTRNQQRERALKEAEASLEGKAGTNGDSGEMANGAAAVEEEDEAEPDAFDFAEPVAILDKLPPDFYDMLASSKWKERKELALDPLLATLKTTPRIQDGSYDELIRSLVGRMTDANIACVISAAGCIEHVAKGLRTGFARYKQAVVSPLLERCKEKKASVTDALGAALDATFMTITLPDILEEIATFSKHKNPQVKEQTYKWVIRSLKSMTTAPSLKTEFKPLTDTLLPGMDDSFEPVRSAAAEGLGTLMKIVGERAMGGMLEQLDDIKKAKVKEFAEKAEVKAKVGVPAAAKPAPPASKPAAASKPVMKPKPTIANKENIAPARSPSPPPTPKAAPAARLPPGLAARLGAKPASAAPPAAAAPPAVKKVAPIAAVPAGKAPAHKPVPNEPLKYRMSQEDAEAQAETVLPTEVYADIASSNWKLRLAAMESLQTWLEGDGASAESELVVRVLSKKPGWKESNFQVYGKMAGIFQYLAEKSPSWSRACSALTIGGLSDKLGDIKLKKPVGDALTAYAEKFSLQFVLSHAYEPMIKQKAPKAQADTLLWVEQAIRDFGIQGLAIRDFIEFLKNGLKSSNAGVRTNATKTLVTLRIYVGADIKTFLQDLNPTLLSTIESDFDKVAGETAPEPTRTSADNAAVATSSGGAASKGKGGGDALDDLFPRQDIDKLVPHATVTACNDANWKQRKESLEQIQGILEANKRLKPTLGDLGPALKLRLADSNKIVQGLALDIIARLASGMNKPFEKHARLFIAPIAAILADQKANIRASATATLSAIFEQTGLEPMVNSLATSLETANPVLRKELATWLSESLKAQPSAADLTPFSKPVIACLEDRNGDARKAAQAFLPFVIASAGYQQMIDHASSLKPASRSTVIPMIDAAKAAASNLDGPSAAAAPAPSEPSRPASAAAVRGTSAATVAPKPSMRGLSAASRPLKSTIAASSTASSRSSTPPVSDDAAITKPRIGGLQRKIPSSRQSLAPSQASSVSAASPAPQANEPPFRTSDPRAKAARGARETGPLKWAIDGSARPDQVDYLHQQMIPCASAELLPLLFSKDHHCERDFAAALTLLAECGTMPSVSLEKYDLEFVDMKVALVSNVDLIFKYLTIRLADTATTITLKCLDVAEMLFGIMLEDGYQLSDYEASVLLPSLINKIGDGKETIRGRIRSMFRTMASIYPSSKIFNNLLEHGLKAKNARVRSESMEELGSLMQRQGMSVCQPGRALPVIASQISDRDAACRTSALSALAQAYAQIGDLVYQHVGPLQDKERSMLDEKLKRSVGAPSPAPARHGAAATAPSAGTPTRPDSRQQMAERPSSRVGLGRPAATSRLPGAAGGALKRRISAIPTPADHAAATASALRDSQLPQPRSSALQKGYSTSPETALNAAAHRQPMMMDENEPMLITDDNQTAGPSSLCNRITSPNTTTSVDALKSVQQAITADPDSIAAQADLIIGAVSEQMSRAFEGLDASTPQTTLRLCKHLLQTLSGFFDLKGLSRAVSRDALVQLIGEMTRRLEETASSAASEAIVSMSKVLNMVLIRIFHNSNRNSCFGALFHILLDSTLPLRELRGEALSQKAKYAELVMKCLWKISKSTKEALEDSSLDAKQLLLDIDRFLQSIPPAEWRRRASDNVPLGDMPLRTVKTILQGVVMHFGETVYDELALIDRPENSFVYQYLFRLLNNSRTTGSEAGSSLLSRQSSTVSEMRESESTAMRTNGRTASNGTASSSPNPSNPMSPGRSNEIEMNLALKEIFDKIGNATESKKGIAELYEFQKKHPEAEARIATWITATGSFFQSYLKRALSNLAAEEAERNAPASGSLSPRSFSAAIPTSPTSSAHGATSTSRSSPSTGETHERLRSDRSSPSSRVTSVSANNEKLDTLRQMFGVTSRNSVVM